MAAGVATGIVLGTAAASAGGSPPPQTRSGPPPAPRAPRPSINIPPAHEQRFVPNEVVLEFAGTYTPQQIAALASRHRIAGIEQVSFVLTNTTFFRGRITDGRPVRTVLRGLAREVTLRAGQPNFVYAFAQSPAADVQPQPGSGVAPPASFAPPKADTPPATPVAAAASGMPGMADPGQYTPAKLRLSEAHGLARGSNILIAVIDSGVDASHAELAGVVTGTFDASGDGYKPHSHGTAIAGAIAARARLMGVAPAARVLAIRAFGGPDAGATATTFAILKGVEHAIKEGARVINMSFAGPADPALSRHLAAAHAKGAVLVAAVGNFGPKSPAQFPAADPNVIAVSATDENDRLFQASNRGRHVALAAPGVDILLPAPEAGYQVISGTSFAAAHVSGVVALIIERKPGLTPDALRKLLMSTARDLGPRGKDDQFGAGLADPYQAILALEPKAAAR